MNEHTWNGSEVEIPTEKAIGVATQLINMIDYGLVVIDLDSLQVQLMNHLARKILQSPRSAQSLFELQQGKVVGILGDGAIALERARKLALSGASSLLSAGVGVPPMLMAPIADAERPPAVGERAKHLLGQTLVHKKLAVLIFGKPNLLCPSTLVLFGKANQLTATEQRVLQAACEGLAASEIADRQQVKISTIRSQLKSIREKTGVCNVRQLATRLSALPGIWRPIQG